eukprot:Gb_15935 [translate_table: standard]
MVQFMLQIKAELENLTNFQPQGGCDDPDFSYYFKEKCGNCGELSQKETCVTLSELVDLPKGRGSAHLVQKLKHNRGKLSSTSDWAPGSCSWVYSAIGTGAYIVSAHNGE